MWQMLGFSSVKRDQEQHFWQGSQYTRKNWLLHVHPHLVLVRCRNARKMPPQVPPRESTDDCLPELSTECVSAETQGLQG